MPAEAPLELRKRAVQERAQMEVERLRVPNLDDIMKQARGFRDNEDERAENWGELDGIQIRGT